MGWGASVLVITVFFGVYAVIHSLLASAWAKELARRRLGVGVDRWYRLAYNIFAGITLLPLFVLLALLPDQLLYVVPAPWRWLMIAGQLLALVGLGLSLWQTGVWHFLGLAQALSDRPAAGAGRLAVNGFYAWVRHPLYLFSLLFLWLAPAMTINMLASYLLFTLYFYVGSMYEERRLVAEFGPAYEDYRRRVPRLVPLPWRSYRAHREEVVR